MSNALQNRYDFSLLFEVIDGNPNGDPDAGNQPRVDSETDHGLVTDVCIKRKIRNYVGITKGEQAPYEIYVKEKAILNQQHDRAYKARGIEADENKKSKGAPADKVEEARKWMCQNFFDVRTFGAVMSTGRNCGQVRGPVQLAFGRSVDPILFQEHTITRMAVTTEAEAEKQAGGNRTMGRKFTVPYALYRMNGFISAPLAAQTGFDEADLKLLWESLENMFELDRSASRGEMNLRGLYVFKHESQLGNAPAFRLFERIKIQRKEGVDLARRFDDYAVDINTQNLPTGITFQSLAA